MEPAPFVLFDADLDDPNPDRVDEAWAAAATAVVAGGAGGDGTAEGGVAAISRATTGAVLFSEFKNHGWERTSGMVLLIHPFAACRG